MILKRRKWIGRLSGKDCVALTSDLRSFAMNHDKISLKGGRLVQSEHFFDPSHPNIVYNNTTDMKNIIAILEDNLKDALSRQSKMNKNKEEIKNLHRTSANLVLVLETERGREYKGRLNGVCESINKLLIRATL